MMPLGTDPYSFPGLAYESFKGLPGLLSDSLPDKFGNPLIDVWPAGQGRIAGSFDAVEGLLYTGARGRARWNLSLPWGRVQEIGKDRSGYPGELRIGDSRRWGQVQGVLG
jgi:hypothetical protein